MGLFLGTIMIKIIKASSEHITELAILFDRYRIFYEQESDIEAATDFLKKRFANNESTVLLAYYNKKPVGFAQLYASFSSVSMQAIFILNDLFVSKQHRKKGIGKALLNQAKIHCQQKGFRGLALETANDNPAQELYERLGWEKDVNSFHYF